MHLQLDPSVVDTRHSLCQLEFGQQVVVVVVRVPVGQVLVLLVVVDILHCWSKHHALVRLSSLDLAKL
jgi:hypothetical protein